MTQAQEMEAINRFVNRFKPSGPIQQKLVQDWRNWYLTLTWYQKNMDTNILNQARTLQSALTSEMGAELTKAAGNFSTKGTVVPPPKGYRLLKTKEILPSVQSFAKAALAKFGQVAKQRGEGASIGLRYSAAIDGKQYLAQNEWHYDNHPKGNGPPFLHSGVTLYTPEKPLAKPIAVSSSKTVTSLFRTSDPSLAALSTNNPYA